MNQAFKGIFYTKFIDKIQSHIKLYDSNQIYESVYEASFLHNP